MRGFAKAIVLVPLAILAIAFAVANRSDVTLSFDPISSGGPAYALDAPLFLVVFAALIFGVVLGGLATWIGQGRHRKASRAYRRQIERLRADIDQRPSSSTSLTAGPS